MAPSGRGGGPQVERLKEELYKNMRLHFFEDHETAAILKDLGLMDERFRQKALALLYAFSNTSGRVVPRVMGHLLAAKGVLGPDEMDRWLTRAFDLLDSAGLAPAINFLSRSGQADLLCFTTPTECLPRRALRLLEGFLRGLSGRDIRVEAAGETYTDTSTVFLAPKYPFNSPSGAVYYRLASAYKWLQMQKGSLTPFTEVNDALFPDRLALDLYTLLDAARLGKHLRNELPGLAAKAVSFNSEIYEGRPDPAGLPPKAGLVEALFQIFLTGHAKGELPWLQTAVRFVPKAEAATGAREVAGIVRPLLAAASGLPGEYEPVDLEYLGCIKPGAVAGEMEARRRAGLKRVEAAVEEILEMPGFEADRLRAVKPATHRPEPGRKYLLIRGKLIELDEDLMALVEAHGVPGGVLVDGVEGGPGRQVYSLRGLAGAEALEAGEAAAPGGVRYDEWDHRRSDYRRNWCTLYEEDVRPGHNSFVEDTLKKYGGYVTLLRKKFEMFRRDLRLLKRQPDGEDIDLDAVVEAYADTRAGLAPAEDLFTRLERKERNIAVLFLLDMSGSTKGWVSEAEKEALVLMCEALGALGDRYAVYGFSGMTRNRCKYYRVKSFDEEYNETVKRRIGGIGPKDYTRMGPAIRHSAGKLMGVEARSRVLVTLSDGKPEDYDAYKGDYGIEDTRKALLESREKGIHPFCITIDKEAGSYLPHMYGQVNYTFIDDVRKLPGRITEIYRRITT